MPPIVRGSHFLGMIFQVIYVLATLVFFASAGKGHIEKPKLTYVDRHDVKISYAKGVNRTLYICCNSSLLNHDISLGSASCGTQLMKSLCPKYNVLPVCKTRGQQVNCVVKGVQDKVTLEAYVAVKMGRSVQSSDVATYVTNKSEIAPNSVAAINVTTNSQQGLDIHWIPLTVFQISLANDYEYLIECQPLENRRAKAVRKSVEMTDSFLVVHAKNVTAVSKYKCCVQVVNLVNSKPSEPTCQNVTTSEQVPSTSPVITCGNDTIPCTSVVKGTKRNITITFELPSLEHRNGKIIRNKVYYYRSVDSRNFTELEINGSQTEAVIKNVETGMNYYVFMTSCTNVGCSPISNTVRIAAVTFNQKGQQTNIVNIIAVYIGVPLLIVILFIAAIVLCIRRHHWRQRQETLPTLKPITDPAYQYPHYKSKEDELYHELDDNKATVLSNPEALASENGNITNVV